MSDTKTLTKLGSQKTKYDFKKPDIKLLETFNNQHPDIPYVVPFECFEFSSLCPKTGQPDTATIYIEYIPRKKCVESKSLKLYLFSFRNSGEFMEDITNRIGKDLFKLLEPAFLRVYSDFASRGGIYLRPYTELWDENISLPEFKYIKGLLQRYDARKV